MKQLLTLSTCAALWLVGCTTHHADKGSVAHRLDSYQVGTTTYADLKHDSHLVEHDRMVNAAMQPEATPPQTAPRTIHTYDTPRHSHWRIYNTKDQTKVVNGNLVYSQRQLTVGNRSRPLYVLTFDQSGTLIDKRPAS